MCALWGIGGGVGGGDGEGWDVEWRGCGRLEEVAGRGV